MDTAVARALSILETLAQERAPIRMSRLAAETGLQKSTAHRLLQTLMALGYVVQEPETSRYGPSLKLWELGSAVVVEHPVKRAASAFLQQLHKATGETVNLVVLAGDDVLYLDKLISPRPVRFSTRPGSRVPAPLTAGGRAILAYEPDARALVGRVAARMEGGRVFDLDVMMADIEATRARGYSIVRGDPGITSLGCALMAKDGRAAGALAVSAPTERVDAAGQNRTAEALLSACARLTDSVGLL